MKTYNVILKIEGYSTLTVDEREITNLGNTLHKITDTTLDISSDNTCGELEINFYEIVSISDCG
jgi:hypothetical protein